MPISDTPQAQGDGAGPDELGDPMSQMMDDLEDKLFDNEAAEQMNKQAKSVLDSANEGGWAISEEGATAYINACDEFLDRAEKMVMKAEELTEKVKLGSSPYAHQVAEFNTKVADGDDKSLMPNLKLMWDGFEKLKEALKVAKNNYNEQEESVVQHMGKLVPRDEAT